MTGALLGGVLALPDVSLSDGLVKKLWYFLGTHSELKALACTSANNFQSTEDAFKIMGAMVRMFLLSEDALFSLTVLQRVIRQVSITSLWE